MYGRVKRTLLQEIFALTLCVWIKAGAGPSLGTPFSYSAPGQANELVLIEWGSNPIELLVNDKVNGIQHKDNVSNVSPNQNQIILVNIIPLFKQVEKTALTQ